MGAPAQHAEQVEDDHQPDNEDQGGDSDRVPVHDVQACGALTPRTTPAGGNFGVPKSSTGILHRGDSRRGGRRYSRPAVSSAATRHPVSHARPGSGVVDVAIAAAALGGSLAQLSHGGFGSVHTGPGELDWVSAILAAGSTVPLLAWRRAPRAVFAITAVACALLGATGHPLAIALGPAAALFLLAVSRDEQDPWTRADTAMVVGLFAAYLGTAWLDDGVFPGGEMLHTGLAWAAAWFAGDRTRLRHEHIAELAERATRNEREAERERLLAVAEERARISRDLHDAAGHAINVIAVRAGTARLRRDPDRSQAALGEIEELARKTVGEIDQLVGTLREPPVANGSVDAPPTLASLDSLVARHAEAGLVVSVTSEGEPRPLDGAVDQAAYRILQESLTNAARHGTGRAKVDLAYRDAALELTISNAVLGENGPRSNGGHGLVGMRERATILGGDFEAERSEGSFRVRARLPYEGGSE
jgi:signal transduction histidine kinase